MDSGFLSFVKKNLRLKLLSVIILILVFSLTGLYFAIDQKQSALLSGMNDMVASALKLAGSNTKGQLVQMNTNMNSVAQTSESISANVRSVTDSAHQMNTALNKVSLRCKDARQIVKTAVGQVDTTSPPFMEE